MRLQQIQVLIAIVSIAAVMPVQAEQAGTTPKTKTETPAASPDTAEMTTTRLGRGSINLVSAQIRPIAPPAQEQDGRITVQNTTGDEAEAVLSFGQPTRGNEPVAAKLTFTAGNSVPLPRDMFYTKIAPRHAANVPFKVESLSVSGSITVPVLNHGNAVGEITIRRYPFAISAENLTTPLTVLGDAATSITLVNGDSTPYPVDVRLTVGGQGLYPDALSSAVRSCLWERVKSLWQGDAGADPDPFKHVTLPANQRVTLDFYPNCNVSSGLATGLLRDETRSARVTLTHAVYGKPTRGQPPDLTLPMSATVGYGFLYPFWREVWSTVLIGLVLALGGVASVVARYWVPNEMARHRLLERLDHIDVSATNLSELVDPELRIAVRVQAKRRAALLHSLPAISAETSALLQQYQKSLDLLETRFARLEQLDEASQRLRPLVSHAPPSSVRAAEQRLRHASEVLADPGMDEVKLEGVRTALDEAMGAIKNLTTIDDAFRTAAPERLNDLRTSFTSEPALQTAKRAQMEQQLPGPFAFLAGPAAVDAWFDTNLATLEIIRDYVRLFHLSTDPAVLNRLTLHEPALVQLLSAPSAAGLQDARLLMQQMREGVFESDILAAIQQGQLSIQCDPRTFGSHDIVRLSVRFDREDLNDRAARVRFGCLWDFPDATAGLQRAQTMERGWEIRHYFVGGRQPIAHQVTVSFVAPDGSPAIDGTGKPVALASTLSVLPSSTRKLSGRMRAEWVGLIVVLFIALLGLITGAREQITKLDIVPGLIAVFLLGFGADSIKSLLSRQPEPPTA